MALGVTLLVCTLAIATGSEPVESTATVDAIAFHVRAADPQVRAWITTGSAESRTLRTLLARLATSDIIVHVQVVERLGSGTFGRLRFVTATATARYLRAEIVRGLRRADTIALIAHELQHAAEVAGAPRVRDSGSMSTFYLGMRDNAAHPDRYDSAAARLTEDLVRGEVVAHRGAPDTD